MGGHHSPSHRDGRRWDTAILLVATLQTRRPSKAPVFWQAPNRSRHRNGFAPESARTIVLQERLLLGLSTRLNATVPTRHLFRCQEVSINPADASAPPFVEDVIEIILSPNP